MCRGALGRAATTEVVVTTELDLARAAGSALAMKMDSHGAVFERADLDPVGDWHEVVLALKDLAL